jgi:hypothetical protein
MEPPNTYTYRQSELPPITDEIESEIAEIDFQIGDVITKFKGNYLALLRLAEILANALNNAESSLCDIHVVPDGGEPELLPRAIGFTDLPTREKQLLVSTAVTSTVAIKMIATIIGCSFGDAAAHIARQSETQFEGMTPEQLEDAVARLAEELHKQPDELFFVIRA